MGTLNKKKIVVVMGADDALLLQVHLRSDRYVFAEAKNEVMTGMLDRVEESLEKAQTDAAEEKSEMLRCKRPMEDGSPCGSRATTTRVLLFGGDDITADLCDACAAEVDAFLAELDASAVSSPE